MTWWTCSCLAEMRFGTGNPGFGRGNLQEKPSGKAVIPLTHTKANNSDGHPEVGATTATAAGSVSLGGTDASAAGSISLGATTAATAGSVSLGATTATATGSGSPDGTDGSGGLTHLDEHGNARMVDTGHKPVTERTAVAGAYLRMRPETEHLIHAGTVPKGDVLAVARVAGILAAKDTPRLIPLSHNIDLTSVQVDFAWVGDPPSADPPSTGTLPIGTASTGTLPTGTASIGALSTGTLAIGALPAEPPPTYVPSTNPSPATSLLEIRATARAADRTGVEMEALVAAAIAALTVYDMCKAVDKTLRVENVELLAKSGGKHTFDRTDGRTDG